MTDDDLSGRVLAEALAEAGRARRAVQAGLDIDLDQLTSSIDRLEQTLGDQLAEPGAVAAPALIALLDEIGGLVREIETARAAVGTRLLNDRRHRRAGQAYRRSGPA